MSLRIDESAMRGAFQRWASSKRERGEVRWKLSDGSILYFAMTDGPFGSIRNGNTFDLDLSHNDDFQIIRPNGATEHYHLRDVTWLL